jgi:diguanylate cyclase (GGDEF)-like protein
MILDIRPFWLIGALAASGFGLLVLIVRKAYPEYLARVMSLWGIANICLGASYAIRIGRPWEGQFVFHVLSTTLVAACLSIEYWAIRMLKRQPIPARWIAAPPLLMFAACTWFTSVQRNISVELVIFNFIDMAMMILIARSLLRAEDGQRTFVDVAAAAAYALLAFATGGVILDFFRVHSFSAEYDFNCPRSIFNGVAAIVTEGIVFPLFLLMVSERLNRELVVKALRDPLTGLYNRRALEEIAFREISGAARTGLGLSVMLLDIDRFKQVNDKYGHAAGDAVLKTVSATLRRTLRDEDFLCRWGGDEFCALLPRAKREQAQTAAARVLQAFEELSFTFEGKAIKITISMGIMTEENRAKDFSSLVAQADAALYRAKKSGRRRFVFALDDNPATDGIPLRS